MAAQKKRDAFTVERVPLPPMTPCAQCQRDGQHEGELFVLVGVKWLCRKCFHAGPGLTWPRPRRKRRRP